MEALSAVASVIAVVGAISSSYDTIDKIKGLPKAFDKVNKNLPLVQKILNDTQKRLQTAQRLPSDDKNEQLVLQAVQQCQEKATILKEIFEKLEKKCKEDRGADKTWSKARAWYREALRGMKAHRVETLMTDIMGRIKTLAMNELLSLHADIDDIKSALAELSITEPSLEDSEFETGANHATQVNESGAHGQQNNTQGGSHVFNSGNNFGGDNHTINFDRIENFCYLTSSSSALELRQSPTSIQRGPRQTTPSEPRWETIEMTGSTSSLGQEPFHISLWNFFKRKFSLGTPWAEGLGPAGKQRIPVSHYIPFPRNNRFVGRVDTLNKLQAMLKSEARVALIGMGGVGKTETALNIAYWVKDNLPFSVFWVSALTGDTFTRSCEEIVEKLALRVEGAANPKSMLRHYLSSDQAGSWLLIVDNLDDIEVLERLSNYLPQNDNGRILFTTRSPEVGRTVAEGSNHALSEMGESDAGDLLNRLLSQRENTENQAEAQCLLKELDYIPLAIKHAATYIERNNITVAKYRNVMKSSEIELANLISREFAQINDSGVRFTSIATTWLVSFEQIAKDDPPAARILEYLSQIEPKAIPRSILPGTEGQEQLSHAVGTLLGYAFITKREEQDVYDMHSLVHLAARLWVERKGCLQSRVTDSLAHLCGVFLTNNSFRERHWREFAPHLLRLIRAAEEHHFQEPQIMRLGLVITLLLFGEGRYNEAADLSQHMLEEGCCTFEEDDRLNRKMARSAIFCYLKARRYRKAIELLKQILERTKPPSLAEDTYWLIMRYRLACAYRLAGQEHESLALTDQVCQEMPAIEAVECADVAIVQCYFANHYEKLGRVSTAIDMLKRLAAAWDNSRRKNHDVVITAQHFLAKISVGENRPKDAIEILENLWEVARQADAETTGKFLSSQIYLAKVLVDDSQPSRAIKICNVILDTYERSRGSLTQMDYFETQSTIAVAYGAQGEFLKASNLFEEILAADTRVYNDRDRALLISELELGRVYYKQGREDEGMRVMRGVADLRERVLGENHELTLQAIATISRYQRRRK